VIMNNKYSDCKKYFVIPFKKPIWQDRFNYSRSIICSYRVQRAINLSSSFDMKKDIEIHRKIISAIHIHRKAMELVFILKYMYITNESCHIVLKFETLSRHYKL